MILTEYMTSLLQDLIIPPKILLINCIKKIIINMNYQEYTMKMQFNALLRKKSS